MRVSDVPLDEFIDLVAQAVVDKMEQRAQMHQLADFIIERVGQIQQEEAHLKQSAPSREKEIIHVYEEH